MLIKPVIEMVSIDSLTPYARNSRTHSAGQINQIAASINEFGFNNPVLIDEDGGIIAGHGRTMAARQAGFTELPCIRLRHLTPEQRRAYVIADNRIAELAGWNEELLQGELEALELDGITGDLLGFDAADLDLIESGGFDERAQDANAAHSVSDELSSDDDSGDNQQVKPTRSVYPLVLSLNRSQYERSQSLSNARRQMGIGSMRGVTVSGGRVTRVRALR